MSPFDAKTRSQAMRPSRRAFATVLAFMLHPASLAWPDPAAQEIKLEPAIEVKAIEVKMISRERWDRSTPEKSYFGVHSANKNGDVEWIVAGFAPAERDSIRKYVGDKQLLDANTALFRSITRETIIKKVTYGDYVILVLEARRSDGRRFLRNIPFKSVGRDWLVTNDLSADPVFLGLKSGYVDQ